MSFVEKFGSLMHRPNDDLVSKDEIPWWLKYSGRGLGTVGGGLAIIHGLFSCVLSILSPICFLFSVWQILAGFVVLAIEAPCCCMFVDYVQDASNLADKRPYWNRAALYFIISLPPVMMCFSFTRFFICGLIFSTGLLYGMMALGKKASQQDMQASASTIFGSPHMQQFPPSTINTNLVDNSQPVSITNPFDSNV